MTYARINKILFIGCIFLAAVFFVSFCSSNHSSLKSAGKNTALLNPKYKSQVSMIEIQSASDSLVIQKKGTVWSLSKKTADDVTQADEKLVQNMIDALSSVRMIYTVSDKADDWKSLSLDSDSAVSISVSGNDGSMYTKVFFGGIKSVTDTILFRTDRTISSYETKNDISSYLTTDRNFWTDPSITSGLSISDKNQATALSWSSFATAAVVSRKKLSAGDKQFSTTVSELSALRHGKEMISSQNLTSPVSKLTVETGSGRVVTLSFYKENSAEDSTVTVYRTHYEYESSPADARETALFLSSPHPDFEISEWTYQKIAGLFNK